MFRTLRSQYLLASLVTFVAMLGLLLWNAQHLMQQALEERFEDEQRAYAPLLVAALGPLLAARDYATITELIENDTRSRNLDFVELRDNRQRHAQRRLGRVQPAQRRGGQQGGGAAPGRHRAHRAFAGLVSSSWSSRDSSSGRSMGLVR